MPHARSKNAYIMKLMKSKKSLRKSIADLVSDASGAYVR